MPIVSPIGARMYFNSFIDFLPKFFILKRSCARLCTRSATVIIFAFLRQLYVLMEISSSSMCLFSGSGVMQALSSGQPIDLSDAIMSLALFLSNSICALRSSLSFANLVANIIETSSMLSILDRTSLAKRFARSGCLSFLIALASICLTRSCDTQIALPVSLRVWNFVPSANLALITFCSLPESVANTTSISSSSIFRIGRISSEVESINKIISNPLYPTSSFVLFNFFLPRLSYFFTCININPKNSVGMHFVILNIKK